MARLWLLLDGMYFACLALCYLPGPWGAPPDAACPSPKFWWRRAKITMDSAVCCTGGCDPDSTP